MNSEDVMLIMPRGLWVGALACDMAAGMRDALDAVAVRHEAGATAVATGIGKTPRCS